MTDRSGIPQVSSDLFLTGSNSVILCDLSLASDLDKHIEYWQKECRYWLYLKLHTHWPDRTQECRLPNKGRIDPYGDYP